MKFFSDKTVKNFSMNWKIVLKLKKFEWKIQEKYWAPIWRKGSVTNVLSKKMVQIDPKKESIYENFESVPCSDVLLFQFFQS